MARKSSMADAMRSKISRKYFTAIHTYYLWVKLNDEASDMLEKASGSDYDSYLVLRNDIATEAHEAIAYAHGIEDVLKMFVPEDQVRYIYLAAYQEKPKTDDVDHDLYCVTMDVAERLSTYREHMRTLQLMKESQNIA